MTILNSQTKSNKINLSKNANLTLECTLIWLLIDVFKSNKITISPSFASHKKENETS